MMARRSDPEAGRQYTIEELSKRSRLSPRTIRFYQTEGSLHPPRHRGRLAYYDRSHLERLRLIADLKSRGLTLSAIQALIRESEGEGLSVEDWLRGGRARAGVRTSPPERRPYQRWASRQPAPQGSSTTDPSPLGAAHASPPPPSWPPPERPTAERPTAERPTAERPTRERATRERATRERATAFAWPAFTLLGAGLLLALCLVLTGALLISLRNADEDRSRLERELAALREQVNRSSDRTDFSSPSGATGTPAGPAPVVIPPPAGPPQPSNVIEAVPRSSAGANTQPPVVSPPPSPTPPPPSTVTTTVPTRPPCTVLPIVDRCL